VTPGDVIALRGSVIGIGKTRTGAQLFRLTWYDTRARLFTVQSLQGVESTVTLNELHKALQDGIAHIQRGR
jgi:glutamine cyclotransferase